MRRAAALSLVLLLVLCAALARAAAPTFEPPVVLNNTPSNDVDANDLAPVAATNGSGTWVVAWHSTDTLLGTIDTDDDILFMRSTDGGLTFTDPAPLNTTAYDDTTYFFGTVSGTYDWFPTLAAHGNRFIAVWERFGSPNTILLARSDDGGATWSAPAVLYERAYAPSIASDGAGTWVIVWRFWTSDSRESVNYYTRSTDDGLHWSAPTPLYPNAATDNSSEWDPYITWSNGVWGLAWMESVDNFAPTESKVFVARSLDGQTWSAPIDLDPDSPTDKDRGIALAGSGGTWVATWESGDYGPGGTENIVTAHSADAGLTWSAPAVLNTDHPTDGRDDRTASVAAIDADTYAAVWSREGRAGDPEFDHGDVLVATSTDGGTTWSAPTPLNPGSAAAGGYNDLDVYPSVAADSSGHALALWVSNDRKLTSNTKTHDLDVVMSMAGLACGNGALDPGEACDDGDRGSLDCCNRVCAYDAPGAACAADADPCSLERCDGAGTCAHEAAPVDTPCALDADICTNDRCDGNYLCEHVYAPRAACSGSARPGGSALKIIGGTNPARHSLAWSLKHGPFGSFGWPVDAGVACALCVYDGSGLVARVDTPVDASCKGGSCWSHSYKGFKYRDRDATPNGATSAELLYTGGAETAVKLAGKGANLAVPALPLSLPFQVQLVSDEAGTCFGATYSTDGVKRNSAAGFKAKSD